MLKAETDTSTVYYTRGFELISRREGTTASYYIYDGGLSVRALTNEAGIVTDTLVFDAFGNETTKTGSSDNPYGFQGEEQDETGLYYLRARYMDPATGTFTTMDTYGGSLSDPMSLHKYLFANSNPVMYSDPSGHSASLIETGAVIGIMSILSGSANAIIAEFIYKNNTDISERSTKDLDKCALTAFLTGFTTCLFSCLATFFVFVFAFTVAECMALTFICGCMAYFLDEAANYSRKAGCEVAATGLEITKQAFTSAEIAFFICGINGGGMENVSKGDDYPADNLNQRGENGRTYKSKYDIPTNEKGYTKSNLELGKKVHSEYKADCVDNITKFKEFTLPSGKRVDYIDFGSKTVYELKPYNPKQINCGNKQLQNYVKEIETVYGPGWTSILDTY